MSYDVRFVDAEGEDIPLEHDFRGGTYAIGGSATAELNITYNYARIFERVLNTARPESAFDKMFGGTKQSGIRALYGATAQAIIPRLEAATAMLTGDRGPDYWAPTEGNARAALLDLLAIARAVPPDAVFVGD